MDKRRRKVKKRKEWWQRRHKESRARKNYNKISISSNVH